MSIHKILAFIFLASGIFCHGDIISLTSVDSGFIQRNGNSLTHYSGSAFSQRQGSLDSNSYYVFDLSGIAGNVVEATFDFTGGFEFGDTNLRLNDVTTDVEDLQNGDGNLRDAFRDLRNGSYSSTGGPGVFTLNADAIADINANGGLFAIGVDNLSNNSWFWDLSATLTLTTAAPEASEIVMMILGILLLFKVYNDQNKKVQFNNC